jgi:protein-arginine kinase activator protein McsA
MRKDIRNAVEGEDYERAGKLRDEIQKILYKWHAENSKN